METNKIKEHIKEELDAHIKNEQAAKIEEWKTAKFVTTNEAGLVTGYKFLDKNYMFTRGGSTAEDKVNIAALDFSINSIKICCTQDMYLIWGLLLSSC